MTMPCDLYVCTVGTVRMYWERSQIFSQLNGCSLKMTIHNGALSRAKESLPYLRRYSTAPVTARTNPSGSSTHGR